MVTRDFYITNAKKYRRFLLQHCYRNRKYIAAGFNQLYAAFESYDYDAYYSKIKELFRDKKIVIFSGIGVLDKLEYDVFEYAKIKEYVLDRE